MVLLGLCGMYRAARAFFRRDDESLSRGDASRALIRYVTENPGKALRAIELASGLGASKPTP